MGALAEGKIAENQLPISELLYRVANEIRLTAGIADGMQHSVSGSIMEHPELMKILSEEMQALDRLNQTLTGLADFVKILALCTPDGWQLDPTKAYSILTLEKLLVGLVKGQAETEQPDDKLGDLEMF